MICNVFPDLNVNPIPILCSVVRQNRNFVYDFASFNTCKMGCEMCFQKTEFKGEIRL